jgi:putative ABC transport system permease protein
VSWLTSVGRRIGHLFQQSRFEDDLSEEIRLHLERRADELRQGGARLDEAWAQARREFGSPMRVTEDVREAWRFAWADRLAQDAVYGLRLLRREPAFAAVVLLTLGLGIGLNAAIFSVVDGLLLKPLPFPSADRLAVVWEDRSEFGGPSREEPAIVDVLAWHERARSFEDVAWFWPSRPQLAVGDDVIPLRGVQISHNTLDVLGVGPRMGRAFLPNETAANGPAVAIISHSLWATHYGADPSIIGRTITLDDTPHVVIGVLAQDFQFVHMPSIPETPDVLTPFQRDPARCTSVNECYRVSVVGRLAEAARPQAARSELSALASANRSLIPDRTSSPVFSILSLREQTVAAVRPYALTVFGMALLVLTVSSSTVVSLLLARCDARRSELAVRVALGATGRRLSTQLVTEGLVLGAIGGVLGVVAAAVGTPLLVQRLSVLVALPRQAAIAIDWRVAAFAVCVSIALGLTTGLVAAAYAARRAGAPGPGSRTTLHARRPAVLSSLAVAQVAAAFLLVVGAGLLYEAVRSLLERDRGFETRNLLTIQLPLTGPDYRRRADNLAFVEQLSTSIRQLPGVQAVAASSSVPLDGLDGSLPAYHPIGSPAFTGDAPSAWFRGVTPGYFRIMGIDLMRGRDFREGDTAEAPRVLVINEATARRDWPGLDPIGRRLLIGETEFEIVGVVGDVRNFGLDRDETPVLYRPLTQGAASYTTVVVRADHPQQLAPAVRRAISALAPQLSGTSIRTLESLVRASVAPQRVTGQIAGAFALLALVLAVLGVHGLLQYQVTQRSQEIGVRMALGSTGGGVLRLVLARGACVVGVGLATGVAFALAATRALRAVLYGVSATDPYVFAQAAGVVLVAGVLAVYVPARRASRIDPVTAIRHE